MRTSYSLKWSGFYGLVAVMILSATGWAAPRHVDGIAAVVNEVVVTRSEVAQKAAPLLKQNNVEADTAGNQMKRKEILKRVLDELVIDVLIEQQAKKLQIIVPESRVMQEIESAKQRNSLSDTQLQQALLAQGLTFPEYKKFLRKRLIQGELMSRVIRPRVAVTEEDLIRAYQQNNTLSKPETEYHLYHLWHPVSGESEEGRQRIRDKMTKILVDAQQGTSFADLARELTGQASGYDLGFVKRGTLLPDVEKEAFKLEKSGQLSGLLESRLGFHVLKLIQKRTIEVKDFEASKAALRQKVTQRKLEQEFEHWVQELKAEAHIVSRMN